VEEHVRSEPLVEADRVLWGRAHGDLVVDIVGFIEERIRPAMRTLWCDQMGQVRPDRRWIDTRSAEFLRYCAGLLEPENTEGSDDGDSEPSRTTLVVVRDQGSSR
jgi:hypothetical protein